MASTQAFLTALLDMQQNAQANLPVEPNNGNPRGANNMPTPTPSLPTQQGGARFYPWLQPSPSMDIVRSMINRPLNTGGALPSQQVPITTPASAMPPPVMPMQTGGIMPPVRVERPQVTMPRANVYEAKYGV